MIEVVAKLRYLEHFKMLMDDVVLFKQDDNCDYSIRFYSLDSRGRIITYSHSIVKTWDELRVLRKGDKDLKKSIKRAAKDLFSDAIEGEWTYFRRKEEKEQ